MIEEKPLLRAVTNLPAMAYNWCVAPYLAKGVTYMASKIRPDADLSELEEKVYNLVSPKELSGASLYR